MTDQRPRWREDFPVRWDEDNYMTRRELAKFLTLGSGLLAGVNVLIAFIGLSDRAPAPPVRRERLAACAPWGALSLAGRADTPRRSFPRGPRALQAQSV